MDFLKESILRSDEIFTKSVIEEKFLKLEYEEYLISEGDEPPDYYIEIEDKKIALEITQCVPSISIGDSLSSDKTYSNPIIRLVRSLSHKYENAINSDLCLLLTIEYPIDKYRFFSRKLDKEIEKLLLNELIKDDSGVFIIDKEKVKWKVLHRPVGMRIVGGISAKKKNFEVNIDKHLYAVLQHAVDVKENKLRKLPDDIITEKWLGIYNDYFLAEKSNIKNVLENYIMSEEFTMIFIVTEKGELLYFRNL